MKSKKLIIAAFLMLLALGSQNQYASQFIQDDNGILVDRFGNRYHTNADGSDVIKMVSGVVRKSDASGHALDFNDFQYDVSHTGWKKLKVADKQGNAVGRYEVDPQGTVFNAVFDSRSGMSIPVPIKDPVQQHLLNELAAKLDAIEVPAHL